MAARSEPLSFLDASFLRLESPARPFHVAGLMVFRKPDNPPKNYMRRLVRNCGRLNELWPVFDKKLKDPESLRNPAWVPEVAYDPARHVFHYALPAPGRDADLLALVTRAHERLLDRNRPLWELHVIEGLSKDRFALYCKVHHALVDGVGALRMVDALFSTSPDERINFRAAKPIARAHNEQMSLARRVDKIGGELRKHYAALPQMSSLLANMGIDALRGNEDAPSLPFTAPRTIFNGEVDSRREIILAELPLKQLRLLAKQYGGTINDVLIAISGGALRDYLREHDALPRKSLEAGVPMSIKRAGQSSGNQVGFQICPFFTQEPNPAKRLRRVIKVTRQAKQSMREMTVTAAQDYTNMLMMPTILLTLTGTATRVTPALNAIVSNVPGSRRQLYLDGAPLERLYPLSVVMDSMALNITVISYVDRMCFAITSCPTEQPGIEDLGKFIVKSYRSLKEAS
jgi:WS/DGAT/MGAT family acyltransferase